MAAESVLRWLALGDSYTIGEAVDESERWPVQLAGMLAERGLPVGEPVIVARTGWRTDELGRAVDSTKLAGEFHLVSLQIGVNNQFQGGSLERFRVELGELLERAIAIAGDRPERVIVLSIPDWGATPFASGRDVVRIGAEIDRFNDATRGETRRARAHFVDVTGISREAREDRSLVAADGLHPSGKMYARWARRVLPLAVRVLSGP